MTDPKPRGRHSAKPQPHTARPSFRKTEAPRSTSQWLDAGILIFLLCVSMALSAGVLMTPFYTLMPTAGQAGVRAIISVLFYGLIALALSYIAYRHHESFAKRYRLRAIKGSSDKKPRLSIKSMLSAALMVVGLLFLTRLLALFWTGFTSYVGWKPSSTTDLLEMFGSSPIGIFFSFISVIIVAPFVEELIFRGVLQEWLTAKIPAFAAVFAASFAFAFYHLSIWAFVPNLILGLACGYLAQGRVTLWPSIALHALYNATLFAAVLLAR